MQIDRPAVMNTEVHSPVREQSGRSKTYPRDLYDLTVMAYCFSSSYTDGAWLTQLSKAPQWAVQSCVIWVCQKPLPDLMPAPFKTSHYVDINWNTIQRGLKPDPLTLVLILLLTIFAKSTWRQVRFSLRECIDFTASSRQRNMIHYQSNILNSPKIDSIDNDILVASDGV